MPVRRARRTGRLLLVPGLALLLAISLAACGGSSGDHPPPTPSMAAPQTATAVEPPEPEPPIPPVDTIPTSTEVDASVTEAIESSSPAEAEAAAPAVATPGTPGTPGTPVPIEEVALPPPIVPLTAASNGPVVPVTGPLLVLSERVGAEENTGDRETEIRRVSLYDVGTERYWTAFDYRSVRLLDWPRTDLSAVQLVGTHLIVWSMEQVARLTLAGQVETVLFEDSEIRAIQVSPDGTHVAILYGVPGTLVVLDTTTAVERLRVASDDPALAAWHDPESTVRLEMGNWHADGTALSITDQPARYWEKNTAILGLDGSVRILPEDWWWLSPDLRYALRVGEIIEWSARTGHAPLWDRWDVLEVETGNLLWTIADEEAGIQRDPEAAIWLSQSKYVAFMVRTTPFVKWRALDTATGEIVQQNDDFRRMLEGPVHTNCKTTTGAISGSPARGVCTVRYGERIVWEGGGWLTTYHGLIELPAGFALQGIILREVERYRLPSLPPPPPRDEIVGPLLVYRVLGGYEDILEDGVRKSSASATRLTIVYDEGTGRSWSLGDLSPTVIAPGGLVAGQQSELVFLAPDGQRTKLYSRTPSFDELAVSPDGRKLAAYFLPCLCPEGYDPAHLVVFALPSGDQILRFDSDDLDDLIAASGVIPPEEGFLFFSLQRDSVGWPPAWTSDSAAIRLWLLAAGHDVYPLRDITVALDGTVEFQEITELPAPPTQPPSRASYTCPENPAHPCRILLDDAVVGEGRRPFIIGFIELD